MQETKPAADAAAVAREVNDRRWRLSGDIVYAATKELPDAQRSALRWLNDYGHSKNLTLEELGAQINYSASTLSRCLRADYAGDLAEFCRVVEAFRVLIEERNTSKAVDFIETELYKKIEQVCDLTREFQKISLIIGVTQIGKTKSLQHYLETHNHGTTRMVEMPVGGNCSDFLRRLGETLNVADGNRQTLGERIVRAFDSRMVLIVDEADRALEQKGGGGKGSTRTLEFIRYLYDTTHCGVVLSVTDLFKNELNRERSDFAKLMEQTKRRRLFNLQLPDRPTRGDLDKFAAHYGLDPAEGPALELQSRIIRDEALGMWLTVLRMGAKVAGKRKQRMAWSHVLHADTIRQQQERMGGAL